MSSSQTFRNKVPIEFVYELLEKVCDTSLSEFYYIFTISSYKKICYHGYHEEFMRKIEPYYYASKIYYVQREQNYKTFCTILRQICKHNDVYIFSKMSYVNSSYIMEYFIDKPVAATMTAPSSTEL